MPTYNYKCTKCNKVEEHNVLVSKRDDPLACSCGENQDMKRCIDKPHFSYAGAKSAIRRAGSEWNDVLKRIKKNSGKNSTIEHY